MTQAKPSAPHYNSLEYLRFAAIVLIVCCHFLPHYFGSHLTVLGCFGNATFFALSGILLGNAWFRSGTPAFGVNFLTKRIWKILPSYYLFITFWFLFLYLNEHYFSIRSLLLYYSFLPWFNKLNGVGHLWFITMIVLCYFAFAALTQLNAIGRGLILRSRRFILPATVLFCLVIQYFMQQRHFPDYFAAILFGIPLLFLYADHFFSGSEGKSLLLPSVLTAAGIAGTLALEFSGRWAARLHFLQFDFAMLASVAFIRLILLLDPRISRVPRFISWIAEISFEIYLVHHVLCIGKYAIYRYFPNAFLQSTAFLLLTLAGAVLLHIFSRRITRIWRPHHV